MHLILKKQAIILRKKGYLYSEIGAELGVAKSTAYVWTHQIPLTPKQSQKIASRLSQAQRKKIAKLATINRHHRQERERQLQKQALAIVNNSPLTLNQKRLACALLFWCEGDKDVRSGIKFINSDPAMIQKFLELLRSSFEIDEAKLRALVHLHAYHDSTKQLQYWSRLTGIPLAQFHKPYQKQSTAATIRQDYPGCISIRYLDASLGKLLKMIYSEFSRIT